MAEHNETVMTSLHDPPRDIQSQRIDQQGHASCRNLERICSFPEKSQEVKDSTSTTLMRLQPRHTSVPSVKPIQDSAQEPNLEARIIITQVLSNKTARSHAGTETPSRSAHHAPIDPYSITYAM